jgi:alpha-methylacyl-CoA racemase
MNSNQWLAGVRVLDLSQYLPGPFATRLLADMGADVVKVEPPGGEPGRQFDLEGKPGVSPFWAVLNAGKTVVLLDLKNTAGRATFEGLVEGADVLLESFRPGVMDRLGFGNDRLRALNRRLIHCALSGFGQTGPNRLASGHDINYEAMTGGLGVCGTPAAPAIPFPPMADYAGAQQAVLTVLGALLARERTGEGGSIDVSIVESLLSWNAITFNAPMRRGEGVLNGGAAFYQIYRTQDGRFVSLSPLEPKFWENFCRAVGRPEWIARRHEPLPQERLIPDVAALFASRPLADWDDTLSEADCCYQAVLDLDEVAEHPHVRARGLVHRGDGFTDVLFPAFVDGDGPAPRSPAREDAADAVLARWRAG